MITPRPGDSDQYRRVHHGHAPQLVTTTTRSSMFTFAVPLTSARQLAGGAGQVPQPVMHATRSSMSTPLSLSMSPAQQVFIVSEADALATEPHTPVKRQSYEPP